MEKVECVVIGAGVVGLAVARRLLELGIDTLVLERHEAFGRETSSRNSEVIHAGMYYAAGSLKAELCVRGNPLLYEYCRSRSVPHSRVGKLIVASDDGELPEVERLSRQGRENGVPGLRLLSTREAREMEPNVRCRAALYSETTGILDTHLLMERLSADVQTFGGTIAYGCEVVAMEHSPGHIVLEVSEPSGATALACASLVNAGGLSSDTIAGMAGIDIDAAGYRLRYCKGEYFTLSGRHRNTVSHLVYPPPEEAGLGVHVVLRLDGVVRLGPTAEYVSRIDYGVDPARAAYFHAAARRYLPFVALEDLTPDTAGIRPKLQGPGEPFRDFVIGHEENRGLEGLVNLVGIESPGLTACLSIAEEVGRILAKGGRR